MINIANLYSMNRSKTLNKSFCSNGDAFIELNSAADDLTNYSAAANEGEIKKYIQKERPKREEEEEEETSLQPYIRAMRVTTWANNNNKKERMFRTHHTFCILYIHSVCSSCFNFLLSHVDFRSNEFKSFVCAILQSIEQQLHSTRMLCYINGNMHCYSGGGGDGDGGGAIAVFSVKVHRIFCVRIALQLLLNARKIEKTNNIIAKCNQNREHTHTNEYRDKNRVKK